MKLEKDFLRNQDLGLLVLRISVGGLLLFHGVAKLLHGVGFIEGMLAALGLPGFIAYGCLWQNLSVQLSSLLVCGRVLLRLWLSVTCLWRSSWRMVP